MHPDPPAKALPAPRENRRNAMSARNSEQPRRPEVAVTRRECPHVSGNGLSQEEGRTPFVKRRSLTPLHTGSMRTVVVYERRRRRNATAPVPIISSDNVAGSGIGFVVVIRPSLMNTYDVVNPGTNPG